MVIDFCSRKKEKLRRIEENRRLKHIYDNEQERQQCDRMNVSFEFGERETEFIRVFSFV